jgi:4-aminobutyrate aminotransferase-like enzyme
VLSTEITEVLERSTWQTHGTFRGHPIAIAGLRALLRVLPEDRIIQHVTDFDPLIADALAEMAQHHSSIHRIHGRGLHWTIELHPGHSRSGSPIADVVTTDALDRGVHLSSGGSDDMITLAPPLIVTTSDIHQLLDALDHALDAADRAVADVPNRAPAQEHHRQHPADRSQQQLIPPTTPGPRA